MDWSKLPDVGAIALLTCAFGSVARRSQTQVSGLWLTGWLMIGLHFVAFLVAPALGSWATLATLIGLASLAWAGVLFMWASVPYRHKFSKSGSVATALPTARPHNRGLSAVLDHALQLRFTNHCAAANLGSAQLS